MTLQDTENLTSRRQWVIVLDAQWAGSDGVARYSNVDFKKKDKKFTAAAAASLHPCSLYFLCMRKHRRNCRKSDDTPTKALTVSRTPSHEDIKGHMSSVNKWGLRWGHEDHQTTIRLFLAFEVQTTATVLMNYRIQYRQHAADQK